MSTFSSDMSFDILNDLHQFSQNQYDINVIEDFIHKTDIRIIDDETRHLHIVETRNRIDCIIHAIKNYENEIKENPTTHLEDN